MSEQHNYVAVRLRDALPALPPAEQRVARTFLAAADDLDHLTITECAHRAATSTATVVRLFQRLGYPRYKGFVVDLAIDLRRHDTPDVSGDIAPNDDLADVIAKVHADEVMSMADTVHTLDQVALQRAVELVAGASRIDLFGAGGSGVGVHDLQQKLSRIGRTALLWSDRHSAWTAAATLPSTAVALAVSHSGATADTVEFLRIARESGAPTLAVTNHGGSALCEHADVVLRTAAREAPFRSGALGSRMAQLLVLDILFIAVAQSSYEISMANLHRTVDVVGRPTGHTR
ncbi:MurR/RpiR family transcriptional regulator [Propionibacteriaceae bacterium Y1685]|uniref:MurR/RpiR family transcriptional regulator n=1 Tax=Microlunatus sp. Y1700 TaxID=3418487 RepID=UPI003B7E32F3